MSNIDKQALREAAERAKDSFIPNFRAPTRDVLALLDENIQLQREKDAIEAVALALRDDMQQTREQLAAAERRIAELDQRLIEYAGIATREAHRVAELEARKVNLPAACADDEYFIDGVFQALRYERDVERAILAAGIKVKES
ncbi:ead/Ea22-like family protein [Salmonella enterica]|nr:ead/Ea22-like family protein [Salmonella enterica subsp. enterica]EEH4114638.1 ead/Ea22-like family protein [Salmonella enterica subsp. enterica serovar Hvittingfoss]EHL4286077.1 ead/Ea22-like family protein [Salmonella enterica subsp. enterica serovar Orientalis]EIP5375423.1 ead/Ea22-like family protein [Salmonella enterica]EHP1832380.1 ead/Ea22-like family protein [Salmonella enterica subsp. enterica serovar Orientalis]